MQTRLLFWLSTMLADATSAGRALLTAANAAAQRTLLGLGTSSVLDVGTTANKVVQLTAEAKLPAVDGSLLTNVSGGALKPATLADVDAPVGSIYYSSTAGKLVYKDAGGTVNNLY